MNVSSSLGLLEANNLNDTVWITFLDLFYQHYFFLLIIANNLSDLNIFKHEHCTINILTILFRSYLSTL